MQSVCIAAAGKPRPRVRHQPNASLPNRATHTPVTAPPAQIHALAASTEAGAAVALRSTRRVVLVTLSRADGIFAARSRLIVLSCAVLLLLLLLLLFVANCPVRRVSRTCIATRWHWWSPRWLRWGTRRWIRAGWPTRTRTRSTRSSSCAWPAWAKSSSSSTRPEESS